MSFSYTYTLTNGTTADATQVMQNFSDVSAYADTIAVAAGANTTGVVRRGKSIIATSESRTNTAYGLLATPDRVQSIVLPTDGLLVVKFQAIWQESVLGAGRAAIFIGSTQLFARNAAISVNALNEQEARLNGVVNTDYALLSCPVGLASLTTNVGAAADVTTGQALGAMATDSGGGAMKLGFAGSTPSYPGPAVFGGACEIPAAAGTYDISVQFKASSGSVTAKNRKLWVEAKGY